MTAYDLFNAFTSAHLAEALTKLKLPVSGSKPQRIQRLISQDSPSSELLKLFSVEALRRACTVLGMPVGRKAEMVERLAAHVADQLGPASEPASGTILRQPILRPLSGLLTSRGFRNAGTAVLFLFVVASILFLAFFNDDLQRNATIKRITGGTAAKTNTALPPSLLGGGPTPTVVVSVEDLGGPQPGEIIEPDFGEVVARSEEEATPKEGGLVRLDDGAALEVLAGSIDLDTELRLVRAKPPSAAPTGLVTDVYYPLSTSRPKLSGTITLSIPYDPRTLPAGIDEADLQAYSVNKGGAVFAVPATVDMERNLVVIPNPRVRALQIPELTLVAGLKTPATQRYDLATFGGYGLGGRDLAPRERICRTGAAGEAHDEPGTIFRIINRVAAPCDFVRFVATTLQEAADTYNTQFADLKARTPFGEFTTESRMIVWLGNYPQFSGNYDFMLWGPVPDWAGEIEIDVTKGTRNRTALRGTLFHEMFHGVQDFYSNMYLGGNVARWWYEATAEWAGLQARNVNFVDALHYELNTFNYALSVRVDDSEFYSPQLPYAYAMLVYYVETQRPRYVYDTLNDSKQVLSGDFYRGLVDAGNLEENYIDFVSQVMAARLPGTLWTTAVVFERSDRTNISSRIDLPPGTGDARQRELTEESERYSPISFTGWIQPLTARFFQVTLQGAGTGLRQVDVNLTLVDRDARLMESPSQDALLFVAASDMTPGTGGVPTRMFQGGQTTTTINETDRNLWVAVVNTQSDFRRHYTLTFNLSKMAEKWPLDGRGPTVCSEGSGVRWEYNFGSANVPRAPIIGVIELYSRDGCFTRNAIHVNGVLPGPEAQTVELEVIDGFGNLLGTITFGRDGSFTPDPISFLEGAEPQKEEPDQSQVPGGSTQSTGGEAVPDGPALDGEAFDFFLGVSCRLQHPSDEAAALRCIEEVKAQSGR